MKTCTKCGEEQPLERFHRCPRTPDGHRTHCKDCMRAYHQARYEPKPRGRRATDEEIRENARKRGLRWAQKNADRAKQERLIEKSLVLRCCEECGDPLPAQKRADARFCSRACVQRHLGREWARANPDRVKASVERYISKDPEGWREKRREADRRWRQANRQAHRDKQNRRRAAKLAVMVEDVASDVLLERHGGLCGICGKPVDPSNFHIDHVIPLSRGGEHSYANTQPAHPRCNLSKGARLPEEVAA